MEGGLGLAGGLGLPALVLGSLGGRWIRVGGWIGISSVSAGVSLWEYLGGGWIRVGGWIGIGNVNAGVSLWE